MHGIRHMKLRDGMYDPGSRQGFPDDGTFPRVERLMTTALRQPRSAVWSGLRAVNAAAVACPPGRRVQLELFSHSGVVVLAAPFVHDALTGFTPPNGDVRVEVHTSSPTAPVGLRCGDRFAVIMPTLEPPEDLSSRITFNPV